MEYPPECYVGVGEDKGPDVKLLGLDLLAPVLDVVDIICLLKVEEPVCAAERFAQVGCFIEVADNDGQFIPMLGTLAHETNGQVSGWKLYAGLGPHAIDNLAGPGFYQFS